MTITQAGVSIVPHHSDDHLGHQLAAIGYAAARGWPDQRPITKGLAASRLAAAAVAGRHSAGHLLDPHHHDRGHRVPRPAHHCPRLPPRRRLEELRTGHPPLPQPPAPSRVTLTVDAAIGSTAPALPAAGDVAHLNRATNGRHGDSVAAATLQPWATDRRWRADHLRIARDPLG